ncbi:hypothetical protein CERZMDRAFT_70805 [Cercospora zeae-maydis SCOH1-5]|uniref:Uncharacterized protein n=1 Tax=Cercospora zeae-maydis SCOH1-5 TaxID=717836 RepID=A0A6A6F5K9_9PEZI|nr:hypothetical protein CERZMDRAFT_70805 [Cercospora zeae-maydis SCOH1-5]
MRVPGWWHRALHNCRRRKRRASAPTSPPWPPQAILDNRIAYMSQIRARPSWTLINHDSDTPISALYRLYERLVLDDTVGYRNEIEYFWRHRGWPVADIPDPNDKDPARYAFLAAIPELLVRAFNNNISMGLARYTPAIISPEEAEALQNMPEEDKTYESVPRWTQQVKPLADELTIPMVAGPDLVLPGEEELDPAFLRLNIRLGVPHILFT